MRTIINNLKLKLNVPVHQSWISPNYSDVCALDLGEASAEIIIIINVYFS